MDSSNFMTTSQWITFFTNAGLPASVAANYAILFTDHRIQMDMLLDLSKEYLYDMGIRVLGDVIAILKYAKEAHAQATKEKVFGENKVQTQPLASSRHQNSLLAGRILDHYTKQSPSTLAPSNTLVSSRLSARRSLPQKPSQGSVVSLKRKSESSGSVAAPKVRRVHPEDEGAYSIKMPSGTTERTRKILQAQAKKSVFARLGDNIVSSSTDVSKGKGMSASVFDRLGPSTDTSSLSQQASSTVVNTFTGSSEPQLQYQGVLKNAVGSKDKKVLSGTTLTITRVISNKSGMQANSASRTSTQMVAVKKTSRFVKPLSSRGINQTGMPSTLLLKKSLAEATSEPSLTKKVNLNKGTQKMVTVKSRLGRKVPLTKSVGTFRSSPNTQTTTLTSGASLRRQGLTSRRTVFDRLGSSSALGQT